MKRRQLTASAPLIEVVLLRDGTPVTVKENSGTEMQLGAPVAV